MSQNQKLVLSQAPHIRIPQNVNHVMWFVVIALLPAAAFSVYINGLSALFVMLVSVLAALFGELAIRLALKRPLTLQNGSAVLTGLLLAMNLPPEVPLWLPAVGSLFAIIIVKELFGGLGYNIFNPALAGRAFLMASWPALMTTKWHAFSKSNVLSSAIQNSANISQTAFDTLTSATPLTALNEIPTIVSQHNVYAVHLYRMLFDTSMLQSMAIGSIGGCIGETSALFLLLGALFLVLFRIVTWEIPVSYILSFSAVILLYYVVTGFQFPLYALSFHLLGGGLFLGAFFMATDMVTSPITRKGMIIFGIGCGIISSSIRIWGGYPEGVSYSILLMNAAVPLIDKLTKPRVFGT